MIQKIETKKKIISRSIEHQQERIKGNWSYSGATEHAKECHGHFHWFHPKTLFMEPLEIEMAVVRYEQDKVLNREDRNFVKTKVWKPPSKE